MNALTKHEAAALPALAMDQQELMAVLRTSLYPGAQDDSIKMALGYCKAAGLDPMQKPVHIVPMWDKTARQMRDVIMPGIGLYRTQAARSGALAGISEPEFGPDITTRLGDMDFTHPDWCKVTVTRQMAGGVLAQFTAREYWIENYATAGKDSAAPNAMWKKRPRGQIAKCAQAQALRMAFPEMTGSQPTAEEMEGAAPEIAFEQPQQRQAAPLVDRVDAPEPYPADQFTKNLPSWRAAIAAGKKTADQIIAMVESKAPLSEEQKQAIRKPADQPAQAAQAAPEQLAERGPALTFAQVSSALHAAKSADALAEAGDLIGAVESPEHRAELSALYDERAAKLGAA